MAEIYTVRSILGDEGLQKFINEGKSKEEIINIAKSYKDEALKSGDIDALSKMNLVNEKQGRADFFTRLGDDLDANGYESLAGISRGVDILASKVAAPIAGLMGDSDKEAQFIADARLTQSINEAKNLDKIATTGRTQKEYKIDSNNLLANAIGSYANDSQTYARNLIEEAQQNNYTAMDRLNIGMATTANATKYLIKSFFYGEDSKQAKDIKDAQKILEASRDAYRADNPDKWNVAGFAGEMITDPLNVVGLAKGFKIANSAFKKGANVAFDLAQLGAIGGIAGAISEYGSYKEKDEQNIAGAAMMGATSGVVLGAGFMALGAVLGKIASRFGDKSTLETNTQMAKDETLKTMEQTDTPKDTDERLKKISDDIEEAFGADENGENIARLLGQEYDIHINEAIKQSEEATTAIDSSVAKFASANPNASASDIEIYINKAYAPSQNEKELTRIINGDKPVTPRMAGYRVLGVLQKTMEYKTRFDRDTVVKRFKNHGFSDELANVFADAYTADDISVARRYLDSKVASNRDKSVDEGRNEWLGIMDATKNEQAANATKRPNQEQIYNDITSKDMPFHLIDDMDMTPQLQSRLQKDGYTLERESQSGVWEVSRSISNQEIKGSDEALQNSTKDAPTPSTATKQEVDNLSEATPNLTQNSIKGDGFVTYPNSAKQIYPHNAIFEVPNEIKQIVDIGDRVSASLEWLRSKHPEMFKTQRAVKEVIDYVLKEPENIVSPKKGDGVILSKQNDKKMDEIGINQNSEVFHANKRKLNSNEKKAVSGDALPPHLDADNISLTGRYSVGEKSHLTAFEKGNPQSFTEADFTAKSDNLLSNPSQNSTPKEIKSQELNLSRAERRAMGIEEPKGKTLVIDEKAVKSDVREFGRLAHQVGLGFKSAKEAKAVMDKCDKSKFDCGS
ncbi:MAG: hypothetical protein J6I71_01900 [Campylobacter sp.]|uniref:hypothetical protein n=1 Tax=Campylobacter sp. TaxID=205 RepID=UPI001B5B7A7F|nr:hypothetical protein [Campylobacter sp.]MBP3675206.1 hypothetical protein [Campylobacter sp.]